MKCYACPRKCGADREKTVGFCGGGSGLKISKLMIHRAAEPVISGRNGSGAVFFAGCALRCVFCQNADISVGGKGDIFSPEELYEAVLRLADEGVDNIDFITAGHYLPQLLPVLERLKKRVSVPFIYNSGGYESVAAIRALDGLIDVYLPDFKYASNELAAKFSGAPDYPEIATAAIGEMCRQRGEYREENGLVKSGVIIRHLVLPGHRDDSKAVMRVIASKFPSAKVSVMRQYTPAFNRSEYPELNRKVTSFEYDDAVRETVRLGLDGFIQEKGCETAEFTPDFDKIY